MVIAVCTKDEVSAEKITNCVRAQSEDTVIRNFSTVFSLAVYLFEEAHGEVDAVYMDVKVGEENGIEAARDFQDFFPFLQIVFLASEEKLIEDIFLAQPTFFLKKPIKQEALKQSYLRVRTRAEKEEGDVIVIHSRGMVCKLRTSDIQYIESQGRKLCIYTDDSMRETNMTMEQMFTQLPDMFFQCHRSYIINLHSVEYIKSGEVMLRNKCVVPVSRTKYEELKKKLKENMRDK